MAAKTPATVLQELLVKRGTVPEYECISQSGPDHSALFEFRCRALGLVVSGAARSKKEAKQSAAHRMLAELSGRGHCVPPPYNQPPDSNTNPNNAGGEGGLPPAPYSYVALLKELCEDYRLPGASYELVGDTGPPHMRRFTVRAHLASHSRVASANTKKAARQQAAQMLYLYLRENLSRLTADFVEEEALSRAHERVMERYVALREDAPWRPDLGQRVADYHLGVVAHIEPEKCSAALKLVDEWYNEGAARATAERTVELVAAALGLTATWSSLATKDAPLAVVELGPLSPPLALAGQSPQRAAAAALRHLRTALRYPPPQPAPPPPVTPRTML